MSIFDKANSKFTFLYNHNSIRPVQVDIVTQPTGALKEYETDRNKEWVVSLTISQNYWANDAQQRQAEKIALECIARMLYADIQEPLYRLKNAVHSGLQSEAMNIISEIEKAMRP